MLLLLVRALPAQHVSYAEAVRLYMAGAYDDAVEAVRVLSPQERDRDRADLILHAMADATTGRALLALETEAKLGRTAIDCRPMSTRQRLKPADPSARVIFSGTLYDLVAQARRSEPFLRAHALLVTAYDQGLGAWREALACVQRAPSTIRQSPEMALTLGAIHETTWRIVHEDGGDIGGLRPNLADAEAALRFAVAQAPALEEGWLRLAHVRTLREAGPDALRILRSAPIRETAFAYLARLFEGSILERAGAFDEASARYAAAAALMPDAQSAKVAAAHLSFRRGHRDRAADEVAALSSTVPPTDTADPWLWYSKGTAWRTSDYRNEMRRLVRTGQ
jgi:tetratricopeptide (TPR) repeat protein